MGIGRILENSDAIVGGRDPQVNQSSTRLPPVWVGRRFYPLECSAVRTGIYDPLPEELIESDDQAGRLPTRISVLVIASLALLGWSLPAALAAAIFW